MNLGYARGLYYWFDDVDRLRPGGPWWWHFILKDRDKAMFHDLKNFLYAYGWDDCPGKYPHTNTSGHILPPPRVDLYVFRGDRSEEGKKIFDRIAYKEIKEGQYLWSIAK